MIKNKKKLSFILAIYNAERTLEECLESVARQEYPVDDYEIIIVDGGSKDRTKYIIDKFSKNYPHIDIKVINNPYKLSEGVGMGKDQGVAASCGNYVCFLDHDNILMDKSWIKEMIYPLETNRFVAASQSMLGFREDDTNFLKYVNAAGVEDAFAIPYSLVSQIVLNPNRFELVDNKYYFYTPLVGKVLYGGANGCIFRKEVFQKIGSYTRDVNVSASMADLGLSFAVVKSAFVHHKTSAYLATFLKKKAVYFYRFVSFGYKEENFRWVGYKFRDKLEFYMMVLLNLSLVYRAIEGIRIAFRSGRLFWILHPFYVFYMTILYIGISLSKIRQYLSYANEAN